MRSILFVFLMLTLISISLSDNADEQEMTEEASKNACKYTLFNIRRKRDIRITIFVAFPGIRFKAQCYSFFYLILRFAF